CAPLGGAATKIVLPPEFTSLPRGSGSHADTDALQRRPTPPLVHGQRARYEGVGQWLTPRLGSPTPFNGSVNRGHVQNESDEPLLLKILVCVTVTSAGPTQAATLLDPVV